MDVLEYVKLNLKNESIISDDIVLARFCTVKNNYKHSSYVSSNLLNIVYKGKKILHTQDGNIEIKAGEAFFITKGEYIMSEVIGEDDYECLLIFFDHEKARKLISDLPFKLNNNNLNQTQNIFKFELIEPLQNTIDTLKTYLEDKPKFSDELINLKLKELIFLVLGSNMKDNFVRFCQNLTLNKTDLKSFMENNFEKNLSIEEYAKLSGRSLSGFKNEFKNIFEETPMQWVLKKRVEKADFLIHELGYDVGAAAIDVGFKTHAHFTRVYKKHYNKIPSLTDK